MAAVIELTCTSRPATVSRDMAGLISLKSEWAILTCVALVINIASQPTTNGRGSSRFYVI
jgi:hypothetical protein